MTVGRKAVPTTLKELRGNPGKRPLNKEDEPQPTNLDYIPPAPVYFGEYATREWDRVGPVLVKIGLLADSDIQVFEAYCLNVQLMVDAWMEIRDKGMLIQGSRGKVRNPAIAAFSAASNAVRAFASEFGLTPSARTRIRLPKDGDDPLSILDDDIGPEDFNEGV